MNFAACALAKWEKREQNSKHLLMDFVFECTSLNEYKINCRCYSCQDTFVTLNPLINLMLHEQIVNAVFYTDC